MKASKHNQPLKFFGHSNQLALGNVSLNRVISGNGSASSLCRLYAFLDHFIYFLYYKWQCNSHSVFVFCFRPYFLYFSAMLRNIGFIARWNCIKNFLFSMDTGTNYPRKIDIVFPSSADCQFVYKFSALVTVAIFRQAYSISRNKKIKKIPLGTFKCLQIGGINRYSSTITVLTNSILSQCCISFAIEKTSEPTRFFFRALWFIGSKKIKLSSSATFSYNPNTPFVLFRFNRNIEPVFKRLAKCLSKIFVFNIQPENLCDISIPIQYASKVSSRFHFSNPYVSVNAFVLPQGV